jgi:hypothetical protein
VEGAFAAHRFRPSFGSKLRRDVSDLNQDQKAILQETMEGNFSKINRAENTTLDSCIDLIEYRTHQAKGAVPSNYFEIKQVCLLQRSQLPAASPIRLQSPPPPHEGHRPTKLSVSYFRQRNRLGYLLGFRPALHAYTDGAGYPPGLSLEILDLSIGLEPSKQRIFLNSLTILNVENLREFESIDNGLAWRFKLGWENEPSLQFAANIDIGLASNPAKSAQFYILVSASEKLTELRLQSAQSTLGIIFGSNITISKNITNRIEYVNERNFVKDNIVQKRLNGTLVINILKNSSIACQMQRTDSEHRFIVSANYFM